MSAPQPGLNKICGRQAGRTRNVAALLPRLPLLRRHARGCGREANSEEQSYG